MVTLLLFGETLRQSVEETELQFEIAGPTTVKALLESHQDRLAGLRPFLEKGELMVSVNRKVGTLDSAVQDGSTVKITHQTNPTYEGATWHNP